MTVRTKFFHFGFKTPACSLYTLYTIVYSLYSTLIKLNSCSWIEINVMISQCSDSRSYFLQGLVTGGNVAQCASRMIDDKPSQRRIWGCIKLPLSGGITAIDSALCVVCQRQDRGDAILAVKYYKHNTHAIAFLVSTFLTKSRINFSFNFT